MFCNFVDLCLKKMPAERPSSAKLLQHAYVTRPRSETVLLELIARTKSAVRELDNLNYRKMKKILMVDTCETESAVGDTDDQQDDHAGGDSSKSNSITSEHSIHSVGVSAASSQVSRRREGGGKSILIETLLYLNLIVSVPPSWLFSIELLVEFHTGCCTESPSYRSTSSSAGSRSGCSHAPSEGVAAAATAFG